MEFTPKEIAAQIRYEFDLWGIDGIRKVPDDLIVAYYNEAQDVIIHLLQDNALAEFYKAKQVSGISGKAPYPPGDDVLRFISIKINDVVATILNATEQRRIDDDAFGGTATDPVCWFSADKEDTKPKLHYSPTNSYTVVYTYIPKPEAVTFLKTSELPEVYHFLINLFVKTKVAEQLGHEKAALYTTKFEQSITRINEQTQMRFK